MIPIEHLRAFQATVDSLIEGEGDDAVSETGAAFVRNLLAEAVPLIEAARAVGAAQGAVYASLAPTREHRGYTWQENTTANVAHRALQSAKDRLSILINDRYADA